MGKTISRRYHLFDANNKAVGRLATDVAKVLRGKDKVDFTPHIDGGDFVVVVNSDQLMITGDKENGKLYHRFSGYPGGITTLKLKDRLTADSRKIVQEAVYGMLPKNKLRDRMMTRFFIYKDASHGHKIDVTH